MVESFSRTGLPTQEKSVINKFKKDYRNKALNKYHIKSHWHVKGDAGEIVDMMGDVSSLTKLWPAAFLQVDELDSGDEEGRGRIVRLCTTGWLPYTLEWYFRVVNVETPTRYTLEIWGDFSGKGEWLFDQQGEWVDITFEWHVNVQKPIVRYLSIVFRPLFVANHRWAMAKGEQSLEAALTLLNEEYHVVKKVPGASSSMPVLTCAGVAGLLLIGLANAHRLNSF